MRLRTSVTIGLAGAAVLWSAVNLVTHDVPITPRHRLIGGLSGLAVSEDGARFTAIGDRGILIRGDLIRENGVLRAARYDSLQRLRNPKGAVLENLRTDAEGLDITRDGRPIISFENLHRVSTFDANAVETRLPRFPKLRLNHPNVAFESLALDDRQRPVVILEGPRRDPSVVEMFRLDRGRWHVIGTLRLSDGFVPVGSDFGPDGALYVLERRFGNLGFRSRIRRVDIKEGTAMTGRILWAPSRGLGNLEGLSVWMDNDGALRATMVADNNYLPLLPRGLTEIVLAKPPLDG